MKKNFWLFLFFLCALPVVVEAYNQPQTATTPITLSANNVIACPTCVTSGGTTPLALGSSTSAADPRISGDATSGFYTAGAGKVDVTISGSNAGEWTSTGFTIPGNFVMNGSSSGSLTIVPQAVAGTPTWTAGTSSGTPAVTASSPLAISSSTGNLTVSAIPLTDLATQAANTVVMNGTSASASPVAYAMSGCSSAGNVEQYTTNTGFNCATGYAQLAGPSFTGTVSSAGTLDLAVGSAAAPSLAFTGDTTTGLYDVATGAMHVTISGSSVGDFASTGWNGAVVGNVTGTVSGTAATVTGAAQSAITSVGTLTSVTTSGSIAGTQTIAAATVTDGLLLKNSTAATNSTVPYSPAIDLFQNAWSTASSGSSVSSQWLVYGEGESGNPPCPNMVFSSFEAGSSIGSVTFGCYGTISTGNYNAYYTNGPTSGYLLNGASVLNYPNSSTADSTSIAVGLNADYYTTATSANNTAVGYEALQGVSATPLTGSSNTAVGSNTLLLAQGAATGNTAVGWEALSTLTTGTDSTAVGSNALLHTTGSPNDAHGFDAGEYISTGAANVAIGYEAMQGISATPITGSGNTAVGNSALLLAQGAAASNTAVGYTALQRNTTGSSNTAVGVSAMQGTTANPLTGSNNTAVGASALIAITAAAASNTAVGYNALGGVTSGSNNTAIGISSGYTTTTGSNNIYINGTASGTGTSYEFAFGGAGLGSDTMELGLSGTTSGVYIYGVTSAGETDILCYSTSSHIITYETTVAGCVPSDIRIKNPLGVIDDADGIYQLRTAVFTYKDTATYGNQEYIGLYAQDVCALDKRLCVIDKNGVWNYDKVGLAAYTIRALQQLHAKVEEQEREIEALSHGIPATHKNAFGRLMDYLEGVN